MPRLSPHGSTLKGRVLAVLLAGMMMVPLGACAAFDDSPSGPPILPTSAPTSDALDPRELGGSGSTGIESFLQRQLGNLIDDVSGRMGGPTGRGGGYIPDGASISPFETDHPGIANLDLALLDAVQRAARDARQDGVELRVSSGWRSAPYQQSLLDDAIGRYGSEAEARRFVNTPEQSTHVTGEAVDIVPADASSWLSQYGAAYGLCQTYANEMWHYELMTEPGGTCPPQLMDASAG